MAEITKYARGLPSLLDLKWGGVGPQTLADVVAPSLDLRELFLLQGRETLILSSVNPVVAVGGQAFPAPNNGIVPAGELWYVWHFFLRCGVAVGQTIDFAPGVLIDSSNILTAPVGDYASAAANQDVRAYARSPMWLGPGSQLVGLVRSFTGAPVLEAAVVFTRLKV